MTKQKNNIKREQQRELQEEEASQIRTRKVRFTGGGFAFPAPETTGNTEKKRRPSGKDAIIVEGRPGQANMKKQATPDAAPVPEAKPAQKQKKQNSKPATEQKKQTAARQEKQDGKPAPNQKKQETRSAQKQKNQTPAPVQNPNHQAAKPAQNPKKQDTRPAPEQKKQDSKPAQKPKQQNTRSARKQAKNESQTVPEQKKPETKPAPEQKKDRKSPQKNRNSIPAADTKDAKPAPGEKLSALVQNPPEPKKNAPAQNQKQNRKNQKKSAETAVSQPAAVQTVPVPEPEKTEPASADIAAEKMRNNKKGRKPADARRNGRDKRTQPKDHRPAGRGREADTVLDCRFSYSGRGFGFAVPVEQDNSPDKSLGEDIFIAPRASMGAMTGDLVQVRVFRRPGNGHSAEGEVISVKEHTVEAVTGRLTVAEDYAAVKPDNEKLRVLIYVPLEDCEMIGAKDGDKVEVVPDGEPCFTRSRSITIQRRKHNKYDEVPFFDTKGRITTLFGASSGREANYAAILHASGIRTEFPPYVKNAAAAAAEQPLTAAGRVDLRDRVIFTIDGADAKDLDDAISLNRNTDGDWVLGVHIADVSHYVPYESCVEKEARTRGTSVYFTDKVIPMLPEELSNGACSLNAGTAKYALSCEITLTPAGQRKRVEIYKSILRSTVRGVYSEVNDLFDKGDESPYREKYAAAWPMLVEMRSLYRILKNQAETRGVMELEDAEAQILLNAEGFPVEIVRRERGDAEKMIEQFMLQANMGVAETLRAKELPCLYRIHEEPDKDKLHAFAVYAHNLGLPTFGLTVESADENSTGLSDKLMGIIAEASRREIGDIVSSVLLRSMMKAKYVATPGSHFGLGAETYCHFTSPIRRYPDLFVHTVLTAVLPYTPNGLLTADTPLPPEAMPQMQAAAAPERCVSSTDTEITAQQTEWKIEDLYMALYMSDKLGQVFDVTVVSVMKFGLFVQCSNLVEGLIPAPLFPDAVVNEAFCTLRSGGTLYTLGTKMQARLVEADPANGRITFAPVEEK
ncbi:MAG: VacB/RNase II family 3'-5' exoribonuclease [Clostridia bacterium]|nr:VacB/RNase II family 3'-5' exoribonuclease [Clostridia bacterium]